MGYAPVVGLLSVADLNDAAAAANLRHEGRTDALAEDVQPSRCWWPASGGSGGAVVTGGLGVFREARHQRRGASSAPCLPVARGAGQTSTSLRAAPSRLLLCRWRLCHQLHRRLGQTQLRPPRRPVLLSSRADPFETAVAMSLSASGTPAGQSRLGAHPIRRRSSRR